MQTIETVEDVLAFLREEEARYRRPITRIEERAYRYDRDMKADGIEHCITLIERRRKEDVCKSTS